MITKRLLRNFKSRVSACSKLRIRGICFLALNFFSALALLCYVREGPSKPTRRKLSVDYGNGLCAWEPAQPMGKDVKAFGTLIASYPASGMRFTWQQAEGLTGIQVGDDFELGGDGVTEKTGLIKTQYPHLEGIWSWGDNMDQAILLVRNPLWAIPSYHTLLSEIHFAHDWETAYQYLNRTFSVRPPVNEWIKWRDYRFEDEIKLWRWHIDFWMEGGTKYWIDHDFERCGQWPFKYLDEADRDNWPSDLHCTYHMDCHPKAVVSYETLLAAETGPTELKKIARLIRGKEGFNNVMGDDAIQCIWNETIIHKTLPDNKFRNNNSGPPADAFTFTIAQMQTIVENINFMLNKYSSGVWVTNSLAQDLVGYFNSYAIEVTDALDKLLVNPPQEPVHSANYQYELAQWYTTLGRGNRYDKEKVQSLFTFWPEVEQVYSEAGENPYH